MVDLRRFPVSDEFISDRYTICVILDRKKNQNFELLVLKFWSRDPRRHGNVGNGRADRMEALSDCCGTGIRSKSASEQPKSRFLPRRHLILEL